MENKKRIAALIVAANMALGFTGCANDTKTEEDSEDVSNAKITASGDVENTSNTKIVTIGDKEYELTEEKYNSIMQMLSEELTETDSQIQTPELTVAYGPMTTEVFEDLTASFAKNLSEKNILVSTEDIAKFVSIANIDVLAEDNKELIQVLLDDQMKEEYLNDAAKVIGAAVMYNLTVWNTTKSTADFIKVSDIVYGDQKNSALLVEKYQDKIAVAVNQNNTELVNSLNSELLTELNSGSLSKLDDGVGFALQVCIATISDGIAKDHLNKENFDMYQIVKTSEKYVSNIFTELDNCQSNNKTITR